MEGEESTELGGNFDLQVLPHLSEKYFIFLTKDGRISLASLNEGNVEYVANAVHAVTDGKSLTQ